MIGPRHPIFKLVFLDNGCAGCTCKLVVFNWVLICPQRPPFLQETIIIINLLKLK